VRKKRRRGKNGKYYVLYQANLQRSLAASGILTRVIGVKGIDLALIQEPSYRDECISGLNILGYTLYSVRGNDIPRACILSRDMDIWELPDFSSRDLAAVLVKYKEDGTDKRLVVCSAYLPYDSEDPPTRELEDLVRYCEKEAIPRVVRCDCNAHHTAWSSTNCNGRREALIEFLNSATLEIFKGATNPLSVQCQAGGDKCYPRRYGRMDSLTDWEISSEPSLSDHRLTDIFCSFCGARLR